MRATSYSPADGFISMTGNDFGGGKNGVTQTGTLLSPPYRFPPDPTASVAGLVTAGAGVRITA